MQTTKFTRSLRAVLLAGAVTAVTAGAVITPALADGDDWHGHRGWGGHEWQEHAWHDRDDWRPAYRSDYGYTYAYPSYAYPSYPYAYAAPAPVYAPPPAVGFYFGFR